MAGETTRMRALQNVAAALPVANQRVAAGQKAAQDIQLQKAVAAAPVTAPIAQTAQATGAAAAEQTGQQMIQQAGQTAQQTQQIGQMGLVDQAQANQTQIAGLAAGAKQQEMDNLQRFSALNEQAKQELYDKQMQFDRDELGRTKFNEIQLADYTRLNAHNDQELQNYSQQAQQLSRRKLQAMESAYKLVAADLEQKQKLAEQKNDQESIRTIAQQKKDMEVKIQNERNRMANSQAAWSAGGTILGAVVGGLAGGAGGAKGGASVGEAAGGLAGSQQV